MGRKINFSSVGEIKNMSAKKATKTAVRKPKGEILRSENTSNEIRFKQRKFDFTPKQKAFISRILDPHNQIVFIKGPAGVSKSYLSIYSALHIMKDNPNSKLMYLRSVVECSDRSMGFLPGSSEEKLEKYIEILDSKLSEMLVPSDKITLLDSDRVIGAPINFLRGANWQDGTIVILDEAQNCSYREFLSIMTRMGEGSKLIILFDPDQSDIKNSGAQRTFDMFDNAESADKGICCLEFTEEDVVRSEIVKFVLRKFRENK